MPDIKKKRIWVCTASSLGDGDYLRVECRYANKASSVLVLRYAGQCVAYLNQCVHMPPELDCEQRTIFDSNHNWLRCSMHGIAYDLVTGASISTMCNGEKLTAIRVVEDDTGIWIQDKRVGML